MRFASSPKTFSPENFWHPESDFLRSFGPSGDGAVAMVTKHKHHWSHLLFTSILFPPFRFVTMLRYAVLKFQIGTSNRWYPRRKRPIIEIEIRCYLPTSEENCAGKTKKMNSTLLLHQQHCCDILIYSIRWLEDCEQREININTDEKNIWSYIYIYT